MLENNTNSDEMKIDEPQAKRPKKKTAIVAGTVAAVVVVASVGFGVWHSQPSFCNAICHSPMDPYVQEFQDPQTDKLVGVHAKTGSECLDCHEPTLAQQIGEGVKWATGNFSDPLESRGETVGTRDFCFQCHDDGNPATGRDWDDIVASTADYGEDLGVNPHASHNGDQECGTCHSMHNTSVLSCNQCHNMDLPEGWVDSQ